jgi:hypothetical protein
MKRAVAAFAVTCASVLAWAALPVPAALAPFSASQADGPLPAGWRVVPIPKADRAAVALVRDGASTVLRIDANGAAISVASRVREPAEGMRLHWRWRVDRAVESANLETRAGDDYAARIYVTFDVPLDRLPFAARTRLRLARLFFGAALPTAAICYVWDNRHPVGTQAWNAYSDHVRMVVVESGAARAGEWVDETRDLEADYQAAFAARWPGSVPPVDGVAVSSDTDQTGEHVTAWFGDVRLEHAP